MTKLLQKSVLLLIAIFSLGLISLFAQVPQAINFQAIARDAQSNPMVNTNIQIRLSVLDGSAEGTVVYQELRALQTNAYGSFSFQIGVGANFVTNEGGTFEEIAWETGNKFLKIDYDPSNTFTFTLTLGTIEFVSVPYAFAAETVVFIDATGAEDGDVLVYNAISGKFEPSQASSASITWNNVQDKPNFATVATSGNYGDLTNKPTISDVAALNNNLNTQLKNVTNPTDAQDAATKAYVDSLISALVNNLSAWSENVMISQQPDYAYYHGVRVTTNENTTIGFKYSHNNGVFTAAVVVKTVQCDGWVEVSNAEYTTKDQLVAAYTAGTAITTAELAFDYEAKAFAPKYFISKVGIEYCLVKYVAGTVSPSDNTSTSGNFGNTLVFQYKK